MKNLKRPFIAPSIFILLFSLSVNQLSASPSDKNPNKRPPKVIRTCCAFGYDVKVEMLPFVKVGEITAPGLLGDHKFMGVKTENNGIIYTHRGGFIDIGHLRDIADVTRYLFNLIRENKQNGIKNFKLGREGGLKMLNVQIPEDFSDSDMANLAGKIAYDVSVWHEIATWYGVSYLPFIPERYSSFSFEDAYSNLLGVRLSIDAILSGEDFDSRMTHNISQALTDLHAVETIDETKAAMDAVNGIWWTDKVKYPNRNLLIEREYNILDSVIPWVLPEDIAEQPVTLDVPKETSFGEKITDFYTFNIRINSKIPFRKIYGKQSEKQIITQEYFGDLIDYAKTGKFR